MYYLDNFGIIINYIGELDLDRNVGYPIFILGIKSFTCDIYDFGKTTLNCGFLT
jgi:hypothetical protein